MKLVSKSKFVVPTLKLCIIVFFLLCKNQALLATTEKFIQEIENQLDSNEIHQPINAILTGQNEEPTPQEEPIPQEEQSVYEAEHNNTDENRKKIKDWNFIVYMAANNNLHRFGIYNIKQMIKVGSSQNVNILVQLDGLNQKDVVRLYIKKNDPEIVQTMGHSNATTTGTALSLYEFVKWAIKNYPARHHALVLWNHGSGIKDPHIWQKALLANRDELFSIDYTTGLLKLDRDAIHGVVDQRSTIMQSYVKSKKPRGIAFNDTFETYLTNQDLTEVLNKVKNKLLHGNQIDVLCMDACHMAMIELGSQIKDSVKYMIASQEVEPGTGYNYKTLLTPFTKRSFTPEDFAKHVVDAYRQEYEKENGDFTQSAVFLRSYEQLENNVKRMGYNLQTLMNQKESKEVSGMMQKIRNSRRKTTSFCDPDYIDFGHLYQSIQASVNTLLEKNTFSPQLKKTLENTVFTASTGLNILQNYVIKNATGINLPSVYGLSIYFPRNKVHRSYYKTSFNKDTHWSKFLNKYIKRGRSNFSSESNEEVSSPANVDSQENIIKPETEQPIVV